MKLGKQSLGPTSGHFLHLSSSLPLYAGGDVVQGVMFGSQGPWQAPRCTSSSPMGLLSPSGPEKAILLDPSGSAVGAIPS